MAALLAIGLLACSSVHEDCRDCETGGSGGAAGGGGSAVAGAGGRPFDDGTICDQLFRPLVTQEEIPPCRFELGPLPTTGGTTSYDQITIFADQQKLERDPLHQGGWDYVDASKMSIEVYGSACEALRTGAITSLAVAFFCIEV
jgi:hypothetical protein